MRSKRLAGTTGGEPLPAGQFGLLGRSVVGLQQRLDQVEREHDRRVLVDADLAQRLQVAQLQRGRVLGDHVGGLAQARRGLELALGVDDLRAPLALGLGLARHRVLHRRRDADVLDLDGGDLDAPRLGLLVDDLLQLLVELLALGQQRVQVGLAERGTQRGLRDLRRGLQEALDLDDGGVGIDDAEVDDGVDAGGDVVARDDVLRRHVERHRAQRDAHHAVDRGDEQDEPRALGVDHPAEPEDHRALVLAQHADRRGGQGEAHGQDHDDRDENGLDHGATSHFSAGLTVSVSPLTCSTTTGSPRSSGASSSRSQRRARHSAPSTNTQSGARAMPTRPTSVLLARSRRVARPLRTSSARNSEARRAPRRARRRRPRAWRCRPRRAGARCRRRRRRSRRDRVLRSSARGPPPPSTRPREPPAAGPRVNIVFLLDPMLLGVRARGNVIMHGRNAAP